jgi:hypothetical protein
VGCSLNGRCWRWAYAAIFAATLAVRLPFWVESERFFNGDEAVQGLMARHVAQGRAFPLFYYGMNYVGALESWITALGFKLGAEGARLVKAVPLLSYLGLVSVLPLLARRLWGTGEALGAMAYLAFAPPFVLRWSLTAVGGYMCALFIGTLLLYLWMRLEEGGAPGSSWGRKGCFGYGLLSGIGIWVSQTTAVFLLPILWWEAGRRGLRVRWMEAWRGRKGGGWLLPLLVWGGIALGLLGLAISVTGGWRWERGDRVISLANATKRYRLAAALLGLAGGILWWRRFGFPVLSRSVRWMIAGLAVGLLPYAVHPFTEAGRAAAHMRHRLVQGAEIRDQGPLFLSGVRHALVDVPFSEGGVASAARVFLAVVLVLVVGSTLWRWRDPLARFFRLRPEPGDRPAVVWSLLGIVPFLCFLRAGFTARYLLPVVPALACAYGIFFASLFRGRCCCWMGGGLLAGWLALQGMGHYEAFRRLRREEAPALHQTQIAAVRQAGLSHLFASVGHGHLLSFLSDEEIRAVPFDYYQLIPSYKEEMRRQPAYGYLFREDSRDRASELRGRLLREGVFFEERRVPGGVLFKIPGTHWVEAHWDYPRS